MYMLLNTRKYPESVPGILSKPFLKLIDLMQAMYHFVQGVLSLMDFLCVLVECFLAGSIYLKKKKKKKVWAMLHSPTVVLSIEYS